MQLTIFDVFDDADDDLAVETIQGNGFSVRKAPFNFLEVLYNDTGIAYVRRQENGFYECICFLRYPSSYGQITRKNTIDRVIEILESIVQKIK